MLTAPPKGYGPATSGAVGARRPAGPMISIAIINVETVLPQAGLPPLMSAALKLAAGCPPDIRSVSAPSLRDGYFRTGSNRTLTKYEYRSYYVFGKCE